MVVEGIDLSLKIYTFGNLSLLEDDYPLLPSEFPGRLFLMPPFILVCPALSARFIAAVIFRERLSTYDAHVHLKAHLMLRPFSLFPSLLFFFTSAGVVCLLFF